MNIDLNLYHFCLSTDKSSWEETQERLKQNGVQIVDGPVKRWGTHGPGVFIYFLDPEENILEVHSYDEGEIDTPCLFVS